MLGGGRGGEGGRGVEGVGLCVGGALMGWDGMGWGGCEACFTCCWVCGIEMR